MQHGVIKPQKQMQAAVELALCCIAYCWRSLRGRQARRENTLCSSCKVLGLLLPGPAMQARLQQAYLALECEANTACLVDGVALQDVLQEVVLLRPGLEGAPTCQHVVEHVLMEHTNKTSTDRVLEQLLSFSQLTRLALVAFGAQGEHGCVELQAAAVLHAGMTLQSR